MDEYQDVNRASAMLVKAIKSQARTMWVVGDARQAIYRFRDASMATPYTVLPLNENRRSHEEVVKVFEHTGWEGNPLQMMLPLDDVSPARGCSGFKPRHVQCADTEALDGELVANVQRIH
jgi:hypothetical protein